MSEISHIFQAASAGNPQAAAQFLPLVYDELRRADVEADDLAGPELQEDVLALDEALEKLATVDSAAAELVHLRYFVGLTSDQAAETLGVSVRTAGRLWSFARAWLRREIEGAPSPGDSAPGDAASPKI